MRELLYSFLYDSKDRVLGVLKVLTKFAALLAFGLIVYQNGFILTKLETTVIHEIFEVLFGVFAVNYFVRLLYSFERIAFIKDGWFEGVVMMIILLTGLNSLLFDMPIVESVFKFLKITSYQHHYSVFVTISMLYFVGFEFVRLSQVLNSAALQPATTFIFSFVLLIGLGTAMLLLPAMTVQPGSPTFMEALFTSTSASCVTGLIVVDTGSFFTFKGHLVILVLMQLGGIGIVSFTTFFATFLKRGVGIKQQLIIQDFLSTDSLASTKMMLRKVIGITLTIEAVTTVLIFFSWGDQIHFESLSKKIFSSIFHAISAFNNAGFSLFSNGLFEEGIRESYLLHVVIACTIIIGGLGFSVIEDVFSIKMMRERLEKPWKVWKLSSRIAIYTSGALIVIGTAVFYLIESREGHVLECNGSFSGLVTAFFQSVTTRTAGFNTVDMSLISVPTLIFMIFLMFIGASSGSTGGGIKTSTFLMILISSIATIKGKKRIDIGGRTISNDLLYKAFSIFVFAATFNLIMIFLLSITEGDKNLIDVVFEQVSAFATVGLSTGITASLSLSGKSLILVSMFVGRIGTLTLALALSDRVASSNYSYPTAHLLIG